MSRIKSTADETGRRLISVRAPKGPDGTSGFHVGARKAWTPSAPATPEMVLMETSCE